MWLWYLVACAEDAAPVDTMATDVPTTETAPATDCLVDEYLEVAIGLGRDDTWVPLSDGDPVIVVDLGALGPALQVSPVISNAHPEVQTTTVVTDPATGDVLAGSGEDGTVRYPLAEIDGCSGALWDLTVVLNDGPIVDMDTACVLLDLPITVDVEVLDTRDFSLGRATLDLILAINPVDDDGDEVFDDCDVCPLVADPYQLETDGDAVGDACDQCPGRDDRLDADVNGIPDCAE